MYGNQFLTLEMSEDGKVVAKYFEPVQPRRLGSRPDPLDEPADDDARPRPMVVPSPLEYWQVRERIAVCTTLEEIHAVVEKAKKNCQAIQLLRDEGKLI